MTMIPRDLRAALAFILSISLVGSASAGNVMQAASISAAPAPVGAVAPLGALSAVSPIAPTNLANLPSVIGADAAPITSPISAENFLSEGAAMAAMNNALEATPAEINAETDVRAGSSRFDGAIQRHAIIEDSPVVVAARAQARPATSLTKTSGLRNHALRWGAAAFFAGALPLTASAATGAATAASVAAVATLAPLAAVAAAVLGAAVGAFATRSNEGEAFAGPMRFGLYSGATAYVLFDLMPLAFGMPPSSATAWISSAVTVAIFSRAAFQGQFKKPETTTADRLIGVFPVLAAALGLSVGMAAVAPLTATLATGGVAIALAYSGVAATLFAALYKPAVPGADDSAPDRMARGLVLQSLMLTTAATLATSASLPLALLAIPLAGLAIWGAVDVFKALYDLIRARFF